MIRKRGELPSQIYQAAATNACGNSTENCTKHSFRVRERINNLIELLSRKLKLCAPLRKGEKVVFFAGEVLLVSQLQ